jgi:hypothetical protein
MEFFASLVLFSAVPSIASDSVDSFISHQNAPGRTEYCTLSRKVAVTLNLMFSMVHIIFREM